MHFNIFGMELSQKGGRVKFNVVDEKKVDTFTIHTLLV
jgi:hypothetical protein